MVSNHIEGEIQRWKSLMFLKVLCQNDVILVRRPFDLLSLSFIVSVCFLKVKCLSSIKPKYLSYLTIFIFCLLILRFICILISVFFLFWGKLFHFFQCLMRFCLLWASEKYFLVQNWPFYWYLLGFAWMEQICVIRKVMHFRVIYSTIQIIYVF